MTTAPNPPPETSASPGSGSGSGSGIVKRAGLFVALAALLATSWMPAPHGLPPAGQVMLAILAFAVVVWMTEALDHAVSSVAKMISKAVPWHRAAIRPCD